MDSETPFLVGLLGSGVKPSLTPALHMTEARWHGLTYAYRVIDTTDRHLDDAALRQVLESAQLLGFDGLNVTFPYKQQVVPLLDELAPTARLPGAVNTVLFEGGHSTGHNTDVTGFRMALERHLPGASLASVVQLGAGGAGAAVADALLGLGTQRLTLVERDRRRAQTLAESLARRFADREIVVVGERDVASGLEGATGLVNCTPIGMAHHPGEPLDPKLLRADLWVADVVYRPLETELLRHAVARGCRVLHGGFMAVYQAANTFELVTRRTADPGRMLAHLQSLLESESHPRTGAV